MSDNFPRVLVCRPGRLVWLVLVLAALLVFVGGVAFQLARADAGPIPTPTRTPTPTPTFTPTFTPTSTPIFTLTFTPPPPVVIVTPTHTFTPPAPLEITPTQEFLVAPVEPAEPRPSALICWPFALAFILVVVIAASIFLGRRTNGRVVTR